MSFSVHFGSASDRWATPRDLYVALDAEFHFDFDPCPLDGEGDGLAPLFCEWRGKRVFCNPPYGPKLRAWLERGLEAIVAVYLLPVRTDTRWFHEIVLPKATERRVLKGRLRFGDARNTAPFPSMVVVLRSNDDSKRIGGAMANMTLRESSANETATRKTLHFVCESCNAKWFCDTELSQCPRCAALTASDEKAISPWTQSRREEMRITRKSYEKARAAVVDAREQMKVVKAWEDALRQLGSLGNQQLVSITINDDGSMRTECELVNGRSNGQISETTVEQRLPS